MPWTAAVLALALTVCCARSAAADDAGRLAAAIDPLVAAELARTGAPGAGVVVVRDGRVVFIRGYGLADREAATASTPGTVWPIASITKTLTAMAVMQQVEQGRMRLDASLQTYLKDIRIPATFPRPITLADALRHTSGLDELPGRRFDDPAKVPQMHGFLATHLLRHRAPGDYTSYSTYGVALAGAALEETSGKGYAAYVRAHVFAPLGMSTARIMTRPADAQDVAAPYELEDGAAKRIGYEWYATPPTSSAAMSLEDMGKLLSDLTAERPTILKRATLAGMMTQQATLSPLVPGWGYGFQMDRVGGHDIAEHGGDIGGFAALMSVLPKERLAIFTVSHGEGSNLRFRVRDAAIFALLPRRAARPVAPVATEVAPYLGLYRASYQCHSCKEPPPVLEVEADGKGGVRLWGADWTPIGRDAFEDPETGRRIVFLRGPDGRVTTVTGGSWRVGERVTR